MAISDKENIKQIFPKLIDTQFQITSEKSKEYNCIAWAVGEGNRWWEPTTFGKHYWPDGVSREYTVDAYIAAYKTIGFIPCSDPKWEVGFEKVALYAKGRFPTHASRQVENGNWTSKLGQLEDIEHPTLEGLEGDEYGYVVQILKRQIIPHTRS